MSDEWAVPAGMTPQDNPGQPKDGIGALVKRVRDNAVEMRDRFNNLLKQAGIRVEPDLLRVLGQMVVDGTLTVNGPMDVTGDATFGGAMAVTGTLSLPAGIIGNDALTSPVTYGSDKSFNAGAAVTTTRTDKATATVTVPAGFTKAQVWAFSDAMAINSTASAGYLYVGTTINAYEGGENYAFCLGSGGADSVSHTAATALTGLTGGDLINCIVYSRTNAAPWAANAANLWRIQAVVIFSR